MYRSSVVPERWAPTMKTGPLAVSGSSSAPCVCVTEGRNDGAGAKAEMSGLTVVAVITGTIGTIGRGVEPR